MTPKSQSFSVLVHEFENIIRHELQSLHLYKGKNTLTFVELLYEITGRYDSEIWVIICSSLLGTNFLKTNVARTFQD